MENIVSVTYVIAGFYCKKKKTKEKLKEKVKGINKEEKKKKTRPDTRHKVRLVCVLSTFENNTRQTDGPTDGRTLIEMRRRI